MTKAIARNPHSRTDRLIAMGQMAATLAHEIRNPLGSMELYCSLLKRDLETAPDLQKLAERIHSNIKELDQIIGNCLQFTRDLRPNFKKTALHSLIVESSDRALARTTEHVSVINSVPEEVSVETDAYLLKQVFGNVVGNAVDSVLERVEQSPEQPAEVLIEVSAENEETLTVSIQDNGVGIPAELEEQLFDPFFTTKEKGTGLGLSVVHSILHSLGGTIELVSNSAGGVTARITLPKRMSTQKECNHG